MKQGVPWDIAWSMSSGWRMAALIVCGEAEGNEFDEHAWRWKDKQS